MPGKYMKIGERIRGLRRAKGLSLAELSEQSGIAEETLYGIEGNLISPPLGNIVSLAKVFEISVGEFFGEGGDSPYCLVRSGDRETVSRFNSTDGKSAGYSYASLGYKKKNRHMEPFLVTLIPTESKEVDQTSILARKFSLFWTAKLRSGCWTRQKFFTPEIPSITIQPCPMSFHVMVRSRQRCWR